VKDFLKIKAKFAKGEADTGSAEVQVVDISEKISGLVKHLEINKKDFSSKRGLLMLLNKRRKFLKYVRRENDSTYKELISELGLRK
jgi:small subunit ribosomal protein S15